MTLTESIVEYVPSAIGIISPSAPDFHLDANRRSMPRFSQVNEIKGFAYLDANRLLLEVTGVGRSVNAFSLTKFILAEQSRSHPLGVGSAKTKKWEVISPDSPPR
jgi:hypothetical protein